MQQFFSTAFLFETKRAPAARAHNAALPKGPKTLLRHWEDA